MADLIKRELELPAAPDEVWRALTDPAWLESWLADTVSLELWPGGEALFTFGDRARTGWVEEVSPPSTDGEEPGDGRLAFWWAEDDEPASRVELAISPVEGRDAAARRRDPSAPGARTRGHSAARDRRRHLRTGAGGGLSMSQDPAGAVFGALADPMRRRLLAELAAHPSTATELAAGLPISRQAVTKHLTSLSEAGLLERERAGRDVRYRVTPAPLSEAMSWMAEVGGQWDERLARLAQTLGS